MVVPCSSVVVVLPFSSCLLRDLVCCSLDDAASWALGALGTCGFVGSFFFVRPRPSTSSWPTLRCTIQSWQLTNAACCSNVAKPLPSAYKTCNKDLRPIQLNPPPRRFCLPAHTSTTLKRHAH